MTRLRNHLLFASHSPKRPAVGVKEPDYLGPIQGAATNAKIVNGHRPRSPYRGMVTAVAGRGRPGGLSSGRVAGAHG